MSDKERLDVSSGKKSRKRAQKELNYVSSLVDGMKQQDANSFAAFFTYTAPKVYKDIYAKYKDAYAVQDLIHAIYVKFYKHLSEIGDGASALDALDTIEQSYVDVVEKQIPGLRPDQDDGTIRGLWSVDMPEADLDTLQIMLSSVLTELGLPNNTVPLSSIEEYDIFLEKKYTWLKFLVVAALAALIAIPLFFTNPRVDIVKVTNSGEASGAPEYQVVVKSLMPVESVNAIINGKVMPITQSTSGTYRVAPNRDGKMAVTAKCVGRGKTTANIIVDSSDTTAPVMVSTAVKDKQLYVYLDDSGVGVDYEKIIATDSNGDKVSIVSFDADAGEIVLDYSDSTIKVVVPDKTGNMLNLTLTK